MTGLFAIVALVLAALAGGPGAFASPVSKYMVQETIERRAGVLVQRYDKQALVFATVTFQSESSDLPGTPFVYNNLTLDQLEDPKVQSIRLSIFTKLKPLPQDLQTLLKSAISKFGATPSFDVQPLPKVVDADTDQVDAQTDETPEPDPEADAKPETKPLQPGDEGYFKELVLKNPLMSVIAALILVLSGVAGVFTLTFIRSAGRNFRTLDQGLKNVASSVESAGGGAKDLRNTDLAPVKGPESTAQSEDAFRSLGSESVHAILMDCYWGRLDRYAAFVWHRLPMEKKVSLVGRDGVLAEYVTTLQDIGEEDRGADQDSYYLHPLPISHLDNDALSEVVRKHKGLLKALPSLRADALNLTVPERVALLTENPADGALPDFSKLAASELRTLTKRTRFKIRSVEEELQVLAMPNLSPDMARDIPTLAWLAELPVDRIRTVLSGFSAQQLAEAWVGPDFVLKKLSDALPEKKLKLVLTYKDKTRPNRENPAFQALCRRGAELRFSGEVAPEVKVDVA